MCTLCLTPTAFCQASFKSLWWFRRNKFSTFCDRSAAKWFHQCIRIPKTQINIDWHQIMFPNSFVQERKTSHISKTWPSEFAYLNISYFPRNSNDAVKRGSFKFYRYVYWVNNLSDRIYFFPDKFQILEKHLLGQLLFWWNLLFSR